MSQIVRTYTFTDGTTAFGSQVETEFGIVSTAINNLDAGTATWANVKSSLFLAANGSSSAPSYSFSGATGYGMYYQTNKLTFSANGSDAVYITSAAQVQAGAGSQSSPSYSFGSGASYGMSLGGSGTQLVLNANGTSGGYLNLVSNGDILTSQLAPLATGATAGFFFLPTVAGTPTGAPTSYTGQAAILIDTTGSKIWVRVGASWKSVAVA